MELELNQGVLYSADGEKIGNIGKIDTIDVQPAEPKFNFDIIDYFKQGIRPLIIPMSGVHIRDIILPPKDAKWTLQYPVVIPTRRHHKKRIQKKWLKRYGYQKTMKAIGVNMIYGDCSGVGQIVFPDKTTITTFDLIPKGE